MLYEVFRVGVSLSLPYTIKPASFAWASQRGGGERERERERERMIEKQNERERMIE